jgi:chemotaxis protein methyltransferase CheR
MQAISWAFAEIKPITDSEFRRFQALIDREAGIFISEGKRALLVGRLSRRLRELGCSSFREYYDYICEVGENELRTLLNCVSTNETQFFREPGHFDYLRNTIIPEWMSSNSGEGRTLRVWSAACATGEEAYSIAMTVLDAFGGSTDFAFEVFASDISTKALSRAEAGLYAIEKAEQIPIEYRKAYMLKGRRTSAEWMKVDPEVARHVAFRRVNLNSDLEEVTGPFDVVFCRNVLIYFRPETKQKVLCGITSKLHPGGYLFLGHAETLHGFSVQTKCPLPNVYKC